MGSGEPLSLPFPARRKADGIRTCYGSTVARGVDLLRLASEDFVHLGQVLICFDEILSAGERWGLELYNEGGEELEDNSWR